MYGETTLRHLLRPIKDVLADEQVTEIVTQRAGEIAIERDGKWEWHQVALDFNRLDAIALLAGRMTNRESDPAHPLCKSTLPDGQRIRICRPPATLQGVIAMSIRRPPRNARRMDDDDVDELLSEANKASPLRGIIDENLLSIYKTGDWKSFLKSAVTARKTIGATGLTGSGKSDFLRRLLGSVPEEDRTITVESDPEFGAAGPRNCVNLFYNEEQPGQRAIDVVNAALSMYPKTLAFQEVTGPESFPLLRGIISGHNSFTSWHAEEGDEIGAMAMMLRQNPSCQTMGEDQLRAMVRRCFDIIVSFQKIGGKFRVRRIWFRAAEGDR